jgi:hypothetical protein
MTRAGPRRVRYSSLFILAACTSNSSTGNSTGPATLSTEAGAEKILSAWSVKQTGPDAQFLIGTSGTIAYLPWQIMLGTIPSGTSCVEGTGHGTLQEDASSWRVAIEIAVPFAQGDDENARAVLSTGPIPISLLDSDLPPLTSPRASVQLFDADPVEDLLDTGTLTITKFSDAGIEGHFEATGPGPTTMASSTFTAQRCTF